MVMTQSTAAVGWSQRQSSCCPDTNKQKNQKGKKKKKRGTITHLAIL
jgi:hypothetical protein